MPKDMANARMISPLWRPRVAFWLILALLLTLAALVQLGHSVKASAIDRDGGYTLVSAGEHSGGDCASHSGAIVGSHCCSISGCVAAAIASASAAVSSFAVASTQATVNDAAAPHRAPSPFFHPPKLIVQA